MDPIESPLLLALEASPDDWSLRFLIAEKQLERGANDEAAALICAAPAPPKSDGDLEKAASIGATGFIPLAEQFTTRDPSNPYGHTILAFLLDANGETERSANHAKVAAALSGGTTEIEEAPPVAVVLEEEPAPPPTLAAATAAPTAVQTVPAHSHQTIPKIDRLAQPKAKNSTKTTAIIVAVAVHAVVLFVATLMIILPPSKDEPEIIAMVSPPSASPQQEMKKKTVQKMVKRNPSSASAAAAPMAQMMRANAQASFSAPDVKRTSTGPLGMGEGDLGNGGFGIGTGLGDGAGGGASFFGSKSTGKRFLFIIDNSASMTDAQFALRNNEMERALKALKGVQYHVILFAGPAYFAEEGWEAVNANRITAPGGKTYSFRTIAVDDFEFDGPNSELPRTKWRNATSKNVDATLKYINEAKSIAGTDWELAFRVGHYMEPPPDVIFFMSDGGGGNAPAPILKTNSERGSPIINTVSMQTIVGAKEFSEVALGTGGKFTIVDKEGKTIDGEDYLRNPEKFRSRLQ